MPLVLRRVRGGEPDERNEDNYEVLNGKLAVGRIYRVSGQTDETRAWIWLISGVNAGPGVMVSTGGGRTLEEAQERLSVNWRKWLAWASLKETDEK